MHVDVSLERTQILSVIGTGTVNAILAVVGHGGMEFVQHFKVALGRDLALFDEDICQLWPGSGLQVEKFFDIRLIEITLSDSYRAELKCRASLTAQHVHHLPDCHVLFPDRDLSQQGLTGSLYILGRGDIRLGQHSPAYQELSESVAVHVATPSKRRPVADDWSRLGKIVVINR